MNVLDILFDHYRKGSTLADQLLRHSELVRDASVALCEHVSHLKPDKEFVAEAAMLHDIGIYQTDRPEIGCRGQHPSIRHGVIGRQILEQYGLKAHALVCERHVGAGICATQIEVRQLPLPRRDMLPISIEEVIVCYADKFYSKTRGAVPHSLEGVISRVESYGPQNLARFMAWHSLLTE
jgi:uncharacterized protein